MREVSKKLLTSRKDCCRLDLCKFPLFLILSWCTVEWFKSFETSKSAIAFCEGMHIVSPTNHFKVSRGLPLIFTSISTSFMFKTYTCKHLWQCLVHLPFNTILTMRDVKIWRPDRHQSHGSLLVRSFQRLQPAILKSSHGKSDTITDGDGISSLLRLIQMPTQGIHQPFPRWVINRAKITI